MSSRFFLSPCLALCLALRATCGFAQGIDQTATIKQIEHTILKVRSDKTVDARTKAAEHLARLTHQISGTQITNGLVSDIMSLLDLPDDSVRYWVATAL